MIRNDRIVEITNAEYHALESKIYIYEQERKRLCGDKPVTEFTELMARMLPPRPTNEESSAVEVFQFKHLPPWKYFLYINEKLQLATTWIGDKLGDVQFGRLYCSPGFGGIGSKRQAIRIKAINGKNYYGVYYKSSGDYARVKMCK